MSDDHTQSQGDPGLSEEAVIVNDQLSREEREILEKFERDELQPASRADDEMKVARKAAREAGRLTDKR